jgi:hypothetical protein
MINFYLLLKTVYEEIYEYIDDPNRKQTTII